MKNLLTLLLAFCLCYCQSPKDNTNGSSSLGELDHSFSISEAAKEPFDKGMLLLHSFEYEDARGAFEEAIKADSTEVMAYWGMAMSYYKALWGLQDVEAGRTVMTSLANDRAKRLALADNELEWDFWNGIEILYGEGELYERNKAYADYMGQLYDKYPDNQEVAAFYALGLMWSVEDGRDSSVFDLSANIASGILEENPNHPGALHYLIHANDDPDYARLSKLAADRYAKVAPDAAHALHMPSHIYLALGMWNDVVASNERSYEASVKRMERKGLDDKARGYHSYAWLHYGYLQQGNFDKAANLMRDMQKYAENANTRYVKRYLIAMQAAQIVESDTWPDDMKPLYVDYSGLGLKSKAGQHFFKALRAYELGDVDMLKAQIDSTDRQIAAAELVVTSDNPITRCSAGPTRYAPNKTDIIRANVMINQMRAMKTMLEGDAQLTEQHLVRATELEDQAEYSYGPPIIPYPSYEQYGFWLLSQQRPEEALVQFDKSLAVAKNRAKALQGKIEALEKLGRETEAGEIQRILGEFWYRELMASSQT